MNRFSTFTVASLTLVVALFFPQVSRSSPLCETLFVAETQAESPKIEAEANSNQLRIMAKIFAQDSRQIGEQKLTALKVTLNSDESLLTVESMTDSIPQKVVLATTKFGDGWEIATTENAAIFDLQFRAMRRFTGTGLPLIQIYYSVKGDDFTMDFPRQMFLMENPSHDNN